MTIAKIQPFCNSEGVDYGYFNGREMLARCSKGKSESVYLYKKHCVVFESDGANLKTQVK